MKLAGLVTLSPPKVAAVIDASAKLVAGLVAQGPAIKFNATAQLDLIAALRAQLSLFAALLTAFEAAGVDVYTYDGTAAKFGGEVTGELKSGLPGGLPSDHVNAFIALAREPAVWEALTKVLLT